MIVGVGIDVVDVSRLDRALTRTPSLAHRLFTDGERDRPVASLAARFAAKEAAVKALGGGAGRWRDAEVVTAQDGSPSLVLHGAMAQRAQARGVAGWHVSLSHDAGIATAVVVAES
ncbi:MAG: holo-ACP synthase [Mycobacteriales bacterium]